MQFSDLHAQYRALQQEIDENIRRVLEHGKYIMGPEVGELEEKLAAYVGPPNTASPAPTERMPFPWC